VIAEESTEWENVTRKENDFGLGFDLKWNMGWMHDTLDYCSMNPFFRHNNHDKLTFSFFYAFAERFILPISHDEVVHGKKSLLDKFFGEYNEKFSTFRVFYSYMIAHPGKKMLFMGSELGQFSEWNYEKSIEWFMTAFEKHSAIQRFVSEINHFYQKTPELWEIDFSWQGFEWIVSDDNEQNIIVFKRMRKNKASLICAFNFSPIIRRNYRIGVDSFGEYEIAFTTNEERFGSEKHEMYGKIAAEKTESHGKPFSVVLTLPSYSATFLRFDCENDIIFK
jgi:1,4-alpha-glucan branching enzyme